MKFPALAAAVALASAAVFPAQASPTYVDLPQTGRSVVCPGAYVQVMTKLWVSKTVTRLADGTCRFTNMQVIEQDGLRAYLSGVPNQPVFVRADPHLAYGRLMRVMNQIQDSGKNTLILGNQPPAS